MKMLGAVNSAWRKREVAQRPQMFSVFGFSCYQAIRGKRTITLR